MSSIITQSFCLFCYKSTHSFAESADYLQDVKKFVKNLFSFVGDRRSIENAGLVEQDINELSFDSDLFNCCAECNLIIDEFCQLYHQLKCLELKLDWKLDNLLGIVDLSSGRPSRWTKIRKAMEQEPSMAGNIEKIEKSNDLIAGIRQGIVKAGLQRSASCFPRVLMDRNSCDLAYQPVVVKTEEMIDDGTNEFTSLYAEAKMELEDSQNEISEKHSSVGAPEPSTSSNLLKSKKVVYTNCKVCHQKFASFMLQIHFKSCHDLTTVTNQDQIHTCKADGCGAYFLRKDQLKLHNLRSHNRKIKILSSISCEIIDGVKYFKCKFCTMPFDELRLLKRHLAETTCGKVGDSDTAVECSECKETFEKKEQLWEHQSQLHSSDNKLVCTKCGKWFIKNHNLQVHLENHKGPALWKWKCGECGRKCATEQQLNRHLVIHKGKNSLKKELVGKGKVSRTAECSRKNFKCTDCGQKFRYQIALRVHKSDAHSIENVCKVCGKGFPDRKDLQLHLELEKHKAPQTRKFECSQCGRRCQSAYRLREHMRVHTGERPYKCHLCPDAFSYPNVLRSHLDSQHGAFGRQTKTRPKIGSTLSCQFCGRKFAYQGNLGKHCRNEHRNEMEAATQAIGGDNEDSFAGNSINVETKQDLGDPLEILPDEEFDANLGTDPAIPDFSLLDEIY